MGRQLRKVSHDWKHPKTTKGHYIPLFQNFSEDLSYWEEGKKQWDNGFRRDWNKERSWIPRKEDELNMSYEKWDGERPVKADYMPEWSDEQLTHMQLYENTSEGTPITPIFKLDELEKLCEYAEKHCYTFADLRTTKEKWFDMLKDDFVHHTDGNITFI